MSKPFLRSATALAAVLAVAAATSALADARPTVKPVSKAFSEQSKVVAGQTMTVMQGGQPMAAPAGHIDESSLPDLSADTDVIACPEGSEPTGDWQRVPADLRDVARPGQCFARLLMAPKFETYMDHVVAQEARTETRTIPEVAEMVTHDVMVTPERVVEKRVAEVAHTELVTEIVSPAGFREEVIPARYETRTQRVMVSPEHQEWVRSAGIPTGAALVTPGDHEPVRYRADGTLTWPGKYAGVVKTSGETAQYLQQGSAQDILCLKVIPAVYKDQQTRVEVEPARVRRIEVPAVTRQVRRQVVDVPAHVERVTVPAVYEKRKVRQIVQPARTESREIPAIIKDVEKKRMVGDAQPVWREVLCEKNASPQLITSIQRALMANGYNPGSVDGKLGSQTVSAMQKFQADRGLPQGQVSVEAVQALGVQLN